jgi:hypothetical protein
VKKDPLKGWNLNADETIQLVQGVDFAAVPLDGIPQDHIGIAFSYAESPAHAARINAGEDNTHQFQISFSPQLVDRLADTLKTAQNQRREGQPNPARIN